MEKVALSIPEAAAILGVSRPTIYRLVNRQDFPSFKVGDRRLISKAGLEEWVREQSSGEKS